MFSVKQKREIADQVQTLLRNTHHPELPKSEIKFHLSVAGAESWSWARIANNGAVKDPVVNPWNELQDVVKVPDRHKVLIAEARQRTLVSENVSYPSRAASESMRDLVRRLADALEGENHRE